MKYILTLALLLAFKLSYTQSEKKNNQIQNDSIFVGNCESGTKRAIEDAKNKIYKSFSYGLTVKTKEELEFSAFYQKYMKSKYRIYIKDGGCVIMPDSKCYSKKMDELIKKEFGANIFERTREDAKAQFNKKD